MSISNTHSQPFLTGYAKSKPWHHSLVPGIQRQSNSFLPEHRFYAVCLHLELAWTEGQGTEFITHSLLETYNTGRLVECPVFPKDHLTQQRSNEMKNLPYRISNLKAQETPSRSEDDPIKKEVWVFISDLTMPGYLSLNGTLSLCVVPSVKQGIMPSRGTVLRFN